MACGEVQWNLRTVGNGSGPPRECRVCGEELRPERRRPGRRFGSVPPRERRDSHSAPPS